MLTVESLCRQIYIRMQDVCILGICLRARQCNCNCYANLPAITNSVYNTDLSYLLANLWKYKSVTNRLKPLDVMMLCVTLLHLWKSPFTPILLVIKSDNLFKTYEPNPIALLFKSDCSSTVYIRTHKLSACCYELTTLDTTCGTT